MKRLSPLRSLPRWARPNRWAELRSIDREEANGRSTGLTIRGRYHIVVLHNWSKAGACVDLPGSANIGDRISLASGSLIATGHISWIEDRRAGIEFDS